MLNLDSKQAVHHERHMRIICVGAGASGLCLAYKLQRSFRNFSLTVYEKNPDLAGTWYENRYPGCACDVPSHNYTYSWEPKNDWSNEFAGSSEIQQYFVGFAKKYNLGQYIKLRHKVIGAKWEESSGEWKVTAKDLDSGERKTFEDTCDIFINANGYYNNWKWPDIAGLQDYKGKLIHTADWDDEYSLAGKKVGLIGNGATAVQVLPAIQPSCGSVTSFIRSPNWLYNKDRHEFTDEEKETFVRKPEVLLALRKANEKVVNSVYSAYIHGTQLQSETRPKFESGMREILHNDELAKKLVPSWEVGCRRISPDRGYLESLTKENVKMVHGEVLALTEQGLKCSDGSEYDFDVIICATGFNTSFRPRFPIIGPSEVNLQDEWAVLPQSYLGIATAGFPNYFIFLGPRSLVVNGPLLRAIETQAELMLQLVDRWQTENIHSFSPKREAVTDFTAHANEFMETTVWSHECRVLDKNHKTGGLGLALWPGSPLHYTEALQELRADDWDIRYNGNRFDWLGNGLSQTEFDLTSDLSYYIRDTDDTRYASRFKRREILTRSGTQPPRTFNKILRPKNAPAIGLSTFIPSTAVHQDAVLPETATKAEVSALGKALANAPTVAVATFTPPRTPPNERA